MQRGPTGLALLLAVGGAAALAQPEFGFMPDGGKQTLAGWTQEGKLTLQDIGSRHADEADWRAIVTEADGALDADAVDTLTSYLATNAPFPDEAPSIEQLPPDGRELAIANCQFCHSFFTGYLVQDRDVEGWRAIFKSPFHMELPMSPVERETFARYSAINMPIAYEDVPEDLRF